MPLSAEELLSIARNYWRPDKDFDFRPENSPEAERFQALAADDAARVGWIVHGHALAILPERYGMTGR